MYTHTLTHAITYYVGESNSEKSVLNSALVDVISLKQTWFAFIFKKCWVIVCYQFRYVLIVGCRPGRRRQPRRSPPKKIDKMIPPPPKNSKSASRSRRRRKNKIIPPPPAADFFFKYFSAQNMSTSQINFKTKCIKT